MAKIVDILMKPFRALPMVERDTLVARAMVWSRMLAFGCFAICPLILLYQLAQWTAVRYWADVSIGLIIFPDPEVARQFSTDRFRMLYDLLWIPMWFEFLAAGIALFITHMVLWNRMDAKRRDRRRARRTTTGYGSQNRKRREER